MLARVDSRRRLCTCRRGRGHVQGCTPVWEDAAARARRASDLINLIGALHAREDPGHARAALDFFYHRPTPSPRHRPRLRHRLLTLCPARPRTVGRLSRRHLARNLGGPSGVMARGAHHSPPHTPLLSFDTAERPTQAALMEAPGGRRPAEKVQHRGNNSQAKRKLTRGRPHQCDGLPRTAKICEICGGFRPRCAATAVLPTIGMLPKCGGAFRRFETPDRAPDHPNTLRLRATRSQGRQQLPLCP